MIDPLNRQRTACPEASRYGRELESQLEEPQRYKALSFEDRLALLVDAENVSRRKNTIQRRIHEARLSESQHVWKRLNTMKTVSWIKG